jgi:polysaccharide pyruvyl transferase WcaK-like protein
MTSGAAALEPGAQPTARAGRAPRAMALFGLFGVGNMGNDGSLEAMASMLRRARPEAPLLCVCGDADVVEPRFGARFAIEAVEIVPRRLAEAGEDAGLLRKALRGAATLPAILRQAGRAGVMIIPGTGILDDFGERPQGTPLRLLAWCLACRLTGTRVAFVSIGAGPIRNRLSARLMGAAARLAQFRSYRDALSREFMQRLGVEGDEAEVRPDLVFALDEPTDRRPAFDRDLPLCVGVGVMTYRGWFGFDAGAEAIYRSYLDRLVTFIADLLAAGHSVRLLVGDTADQPAIDAALEMLGRRCGRAQLERVAAEPIASLTELMEEIALTDVVVATRFHNIVCALKMGRPVISIGYARKNEVLMESMGLGDFCQHVDELDLDRLNTQFARLVEQRETLAEGVRAGVAEAKRRLAEQDARLLDWIDAAIAMR